MIKNKLKEKWAAGAATINGWCSIGNSFSAEIMAASGYDSLTVDVQHGALDYSALLPMFQAMRASGVVPMARVPWNEPGIIMKALDAGAYGIICPMVNTAEEAARFASYMRYPPRGQRSFGPTRVNFAAGENYAAEANDEIIALAMVETGDGLKNVDAIAATEGIDGLYIGPSDLTLGVMNGRLAAGFDRQEPEMIDAIKTILRAAKDHGKRAILHCGAADYAAQAIGWGFDATTVAGDSRLLHAAATASVAKWRESVGARSAAGTTTQAY